MLRLKLKLLQSLLKLRAMDKKRLLQLIANRAKGEKCRVLFDMLMEALECTYEVKQHEVFLKLKEAVEAEQEAIKELMSRPVDVPEVGSEGIPLKGYDAGDDGEGNIVFGSISKEGIQKDIDVLGSSDIHPNEDKVVGRNRVFK